MKKIQLTKESLPDDVNHEHMYVYTQTGVVMRFLDLFLQKSF